ncbi:UNVERIFIED_CONTAM: hypothetical protein K2H54_039228 [Gekko kuhli]
MDTSPKDIREGWTRVTCSVSHHCPEEPLILTIHGLEGTRFSSQKMAISNRVIRTVVDLEMSWEDHGKSLICSLRRWNGLEISRSTMQLEVKYAPKDVQVIASPGTTVREGETLSLECRIKSGNPEVSEYLWYKNDQLMYKQPKCNRIEFETKGDRHSGAYRCEAKNSVGSKKSEVLSIDVQYPPKEVIVKWRSRGVITEGDRVELRCSSKGNPPISRYEWYKLPQTDVFRNSDWLHFNAIQLENAGAYYCVANNSLGQSESSPVTLDVLYAPKDVQLAIENNKLPIKETDTVRLNCSFRQSNPSNDIWYKWYKAHSKDASAPATSGPKPTAGSGAPVPPLPSSPAPCDGGTLWEEFSFFSELLDHFVKTQNQFIQLTRKFQKALLQKRQKTRVARSKIKKQ